jgi:hypothetical protein
MLYQSSLRLMKTKFYSALFSLLSIGILTACKKDPIKVEFMKFQNQVALFTVLNNTDQDIYTVSFEITLFSEDKSVLKIDTMNFSNTSDNAGNQIPFLEAGADTFFPYSITDKTTSASARAIDFGFSK